MKLLTYCFVLLVAGFGAMIFTEDVKYFFLSVPYQFREKHSQFLESVSPDIEKALQEAPVSGSRYTASADGTVDEGVSYASWHDSVNHTFYYRFSNIGKTNLRIRARTLLELTGRTSLLLPVNKTTYVLVKSDREPVWKALWFSIKQNGEWTFSKYGVMNVLSPKQ